MSKKQSGDSEMKAIQEDMLPQEATEESDSFSHPSIVSVPPPVTAPRAVDKAHNIFLYVMLPLAIALGVTSIVLFVQKQLEANVIARIIAAYCMFCSIILTCMLCTMHLSAFSNPVEQRFIIRIIIMCPIYAVDSFLALQWFHLGNIIAVVRDTYEGYVIFQFFQLLLTYAGGDANCVANWATSHPTMKHPFPFGRLTPVNLNQNTLDWWKWLVTQYVVLNPLLTLITVPLYFTGHYEEGNLGVSSAYFWIAGLRFWSVGGALTALVYFLFAVEPQIKEKSPEAKFLAVKAVVFATFWQSVLFAGLSHYDIIHKTVMWSADEVATGLNNFCVCIEMFCVSIIHRWVYGDGPYLTPEGRYTPNGYVIRYLFNVDDVTQTIHRDLIQTTIRKVKEVGTPKGQNDVVP